MNSLKIHLLANRSRRLGARLREIQAEIKSLDHRASRIEDDESIGAEAKAAAIKRLRDMSGPLHAQLRALSDQVTDGPVPRKVTTAKTKTPVPSLARTPEFPAADMGRRVGKCIRAFNSVREAYAA